MTPRNALPLLLLAACSPPPSVQAVDAWLKGYAVMDVEQVVRATYSGDRELVRGALAELGTVPTGTLATSLPPRPLSHELIEIESKDEAKGRHVVLTMMTLKNPLPYMSTRVGNPLEEIPKTRELRRRFLVVLEDGRWGVKLDLPRVIARVEFVAALQRRVAAADFAGAEAMLSTIPPPPDEANALQLSDRLRESLTQEIEKAKKKLQARTTTTAP